MTSLFDRCFRKVGITVLGLYARIKFNTRCSVQEEPPKGALILCNHTMMWDFANLVWAMFPRSDQRFVTTSVSYDKTRFSRWAFKHLGMIRKNQGATDLASVKEMMKAAREGGSVVIYASGMLSFDGRPAVNVLPGTGSLPKLLRTDVYAALTHGGFLTSPRYSHEKMRGRIDLEIKRIYTAEEASRLSAEQMQQGINEALNFNDWDWQEKNRVPFKRLDSVRNLSRTLYMCPACRKEGVIAEGKHLLRCTHCGLTARRDRYGFFSSDNSDCPKRMDKWVDLELEQIRQQLAEEDFALYSSVTAYARPQNQSEEVRCLGRGELRMTRSDLCFTGGSEDLRFRFTDFQFIILDDIKSLLINTDKTNCRFEFDDPRLVTKWFFVHRELRGL